MAHFQTLALIYQASFKEHPIRIWLYLCSMTIMSSLIFMLILRFSVQWCKDWNTKQLQALLLAITLLFRNELIANNDLSQELKTCWHDNNTNRLSGAYRSLFMHRVKWKLTLCSMLYVTSYLLFADVIACVRYYRCNGMEHSKHQS